MEKQQLKVNLLRSSLVITLRCTLKCRLCAAYVPYYKVSPHWDYDYLAKTIDQYFKLVDHVDEFTVTGGEPLLHKELDRILTKVLSYSSQIGYVLLLSNGTMLIPENVLNILKENRDKCKVAISHYGTLSSRADELKDILAQSDIDCRFIDYYSKNMHCDGWVDYGDHTQKHFTREERDEKGSKCGIRRNHGFLIQYNDPKK